MRLNFVGNNCHSEVHEQSRMGRVSSEVDMKVSGVGQEVRGVKWSILSIVVVVSHNSTMSIEEERTQD